MSALPTSAAREAVPSGIPGVRLPGPYPVGDYAKGLQTFLRGRPRMQLIGEVWNLRTSRVKVYFELRDADGAVPCAMWRDDFEALRIPPGEVADGVQVLVAGGPDYYPGSREASPAFSFHVTRLQIAGEGDLLAQLDRLRRRLAAEGLFERQKALTWSALPRSIGVVTAPTGKARDDVLAGLARRGWAGRLVWGYAPVQDRHAAPRISQVLRDLAAAGGVEVIVVARGGGSLADLFCFCDEALCRTVALLPVPVIASVGHHTDHTLLDDVAAASCSTPTHAAETAVRCDLVEARAGTARAAVRLQQHGACTSTARPATARLAERLQQHGRRAVVTRARTLAALSRAPAEHVRRHRARLHQQLREIRAAGTRRALDERRLSGRAALVLGRKASATTLETVRAGATLQTLSRELSRTATDASAERRRDLDRLSLALAAHDPQRTLERGYALVEGRDGAPLTTASAARDARDLRVRFADGTVDTKVQEA